MSHTGKPAWEQLRGQGKSRFILRGIVQRGFKIAAPSTAGFFLTDLLAQRIANPVSETVFLANIYLLLTLLVGWGEGAFIWSKCERDVKIAGLKRPSRR